MSDPTKTPPLLKRSSLETLSTEAVLSQNLQNLEIGLRPSSSFELTSPLGKKTIKRRLKLEWNVHKAYVDKKKKNATTTLTPSESVEDVFEISENLSELNRDDLIDLIVQASNNRISKDEIEDVVVDHFDPEHVALTILKKGI
jgi:hypothetical protein